MSSGRPGPHVWLAVLRRCLWLLAQALAVTLLVFTTAGRSNSDDATPMFINSEPVFIGSRAWQLVETIGRNGASKPQATVELMRLGGAALPHILPKLDSLEPAARQHLLRALAPLAVRMQLTQTPPSAEESEALWLSFWNDHFVDFHSAMARRVVRRFVQGPSASRAHEVRRLDTFALGELIRELTRLARERATSGAARPVVDLLCSIATEPSTPCGRHDLQDDTRSIAEAWRAWWLSEHHRFESPNGAERFLSPILQTEYANWVRTSARALITGRGFGTFPWRRCLLSLVHFAVALGGAFWVTQVLERRQLGTRSRLGSTAWPFLTIPPVLLLGLGTWTQVLGYGVIGAAAGAVMGAWVSQYRPFLPIGSPAIASIYPHVSHLLGVVLGTEALSHVDGLGTYLFGALRSHDLQTTIWTTLGCATLAALGHASTEALGARNSVRKNGPIRGPAATRRLWTPRARSLTVVALVTLLLVATLVGRFRDGHFGYVGQRVHLPELATWMLYATANSLGAMALVVSLSTLVGVPLGVLGLRRRRTVLLRWLELTCTLPAFVLTALWASGSTRAPLVVLSLGVAMQRALQIAVLVSRAERVDASQPPPSHPVTRLEVTERVRWRPLLWVAAAHSTVIFAAEHAALLLLGILAPVPNTWLGTVCAAVMGAADVGVVGLAIAAIGVTAVPWALWSQAGSRRGGDVAPASN